MEEKIIQITSGKGPEECERVVFVIFEKMKKQLVKENLLFEIVEENLGKQKNTYLSIMFKVKGKLVNDFCNEWQGTIQWIGQSPYRKFHKRKNWFIGVIVHNVPKNETIKESDISFQTLKSSGPGGQNVNKIESAVRATHIPTGISVTSSTERSQLLNKKNALVRLKNKLLGIYIENQNKKYYEKWMEHNILERGNPIKIFKESIC